MSTDTNITRQLRDMNPENEIIVQADGKNIAGTTVSGFVEDHDAALLEARKEGAKMMLQQMEDVLYMVASEGALQAKGMSQEFSEGAAEGCRVQLIAAKLALSAGAVDFTQELRP